MRQPVQLWTAGLPSIKNDRTLVARADARDTLSVWLVSCRDLMKAAARAALKSCRSPFVSPYNFESQGFGSSMLP